MYKYITLNGDVYVKTEPTFWTKERVFWGASALAVIVGVLRNLTKRSA